MKKICSKRIYIIIFAALFALLMALSVFMIFDPFAIKEKNVSKVSPVAVAVAPVSDNNALKSSYFIGDSIEINPLEISDGINTAMSDSAFVSFPGGKVSGAETLVLDEAGKYSVTYYANTAGKRLVYMHEFTVKDEIFTLSNANSALSYGSHPSDTLNQKGIVASIARNDVLRYNKVIDLSKMPADETFLRFFAPPEQIGVADA